MYNLMKYEMKSRYKSLLWLVGIFIVFNAFIMIKITMDGGMLESSNGVTYSLANSTSSQVNFMLLAMACFYGSLVLLLIVIWGFQSMTKDLHQPTGYLMLSIPQHGYSIVGAKFLATLAEFITGLLLTGAFFVLQVLNIARIGRVDIYAYVAEYSDIIVRISFFGVLMIVYLFVHIMIVGYFSTVFIRSFFTGRKFGNFLSFVIFIVTMILIFKAIQTIEFIFPLKVDIGFLIFGRLANEMSAVPINIAGMITEAAILFALFLGTGWLLENRVEV